MATATIEKLPFTIVSNPSFKSFEVSFTGKPSEAVRNALKALRFRWNPKRSVWYGFKSEREIRDAILNANDEPLNVDEEFTTVYTDGYFGAGAVYGSKSNKSLYGAELTKAIREDLKRVGIKATVRKYHGGSSIAVTISASASDYVPFETFLQSFELHDYVDFYNADDQRVCERDFWSAGHDQQKEIIRATALHYYKGYVEKESFSVNHYYLDRLTVFTPEALERIKLANQVVMAYRYDESNSQVDYFNTNFYYDIYIKNTL